MRRLFQIGSKHPDAINATNEWLKNASGQILCPECKSILRNRYPQPIDVVLREWKDHAITGGVWWTGITLFHKEFIDQVFDYLKGFVLGRCYDSNGTLIENYVTCYGQKYLVERGDKSSQYFICASCGSVSNNGWFGKKIYTLNCYLTDGLIFQDKACRMYLDEQIANKINFSFWPDADLRVHEVLEKPLDGQHLSCDPPGLW